jgi:hypothetical protein
MPTEFYQTLKMLKPDGIPFDQNQDFMRFLKQRYSWFNFPLADVPWQDLSKGVSGPGRGPLPKEERARLARENATILDDKGNMVKAC